MYIIVKLKCSLKNQQPKQILEIQMAKDKKNDFCQNVLGKMQNGKKTKK